MSIYKIMICFRPEELQPITGMLKTPPVRMVPPYMPGVRMDRGHLRPYIRRVSGRFGIPAQRFQYVYKEFLENSLISSIPTIIKPSTLLISSIKHILAK